MRWTGVRALVVGIVVVAGSATLASCGMARGASAQPAPTASDPPSRAEPLCDSIGQLDRLVVTRSDKFPQNHLRFSFPATVTVTDPELVRAAARAVCSLPPMPSGTFHCPMDIGVDYGLHFSTASRHFPTVVVDATGCETVEHAGAKRWAARTPGFFTALGTAMGLTGANRGTFAGRRSGG